MSRMLAVAQRVVRQLLRDRRLLALSILDPLVILYFLKLFFDTLPPGFAVARYAVPLAAFLVHFLSFLLCALVLVQERTGGTLERMFINGFRRMDIIGGYVLGYLGLATLQTIIVLVEVLLLFSLHYPAGVLLALFVVIWLLAIASVLLGIFLSTFARRESQVLPFIPLIMLPSVFLSGLLVSVDRLPGWAQGLGHLLPLFYANTVLQEVIRPAGALPHEWGALAVLGGYSLVLLLLASRTLAEVE
jgi:ABC-2 type transport system permease protein